MIDPLKLHAYADGQADRDEIAEIEARLETCAASQAELAAIRSFKECVAKHPFETDHKDCWKACVGRLNEIDRAGRTERFVSRYAWALAAGIVGLVVLTGVANRGARQTSVGTADLAQIMSQVGTRGRSVNPQDQAIAELQLRKVRLAIENEGRQTNRTLRVVAVSNISVDGMMVQRMTLRDSFGQMALLALPSEARFEGLEPVSGTTMQAGRIDDLNCIVWSLGDRTLVLVGDREPAILARVAETIHESR